MRVTQLKNLTILKKYVKELRQNQTIPEQILWSILRNRRFFDLKFRRQAAIDNKYIADFVCYEKKVIIELDGREHLEKENIIKDNNRTQYLEENGFKVIRFYNTDILKRLDNVLMFLYNELIESPSSVLRTPSPVKGEGTKLDNLSS